MRQHRWPLRIDSSFIFKILFHGVFDEHNGTGARLRRSMLEVGGLGRQAATTQTAGKAPTAPCNAFAKQRPRSDQNLSRLSPAYVVQ